MQLVIAPCSASAATHAVMAWHYSKRMPIGKTVRFGVWEDDRFIGVVLFARGASPALGDAHGLDQTEVCELVRVALRDHQAPVTEIVARTLRLLKAQNPGLRLVVSFADPAQGHVGGIYQAGNWIYAGETHPAPEYFYKGRWRHNRDLSTPGFAKKRGDGVPSLTGEQKASLPRRVGPGKHRYLYPLDRPTRRRIVKLAQPYPRGRGLEGEPVPPQGAGPGSTPGDRSTETL